MAPNKQTTATTHRATGPITRSVARRSSVDSSSTDGSSNAAPKVLKDAKQTSRVAKKAKAQHRRAQRSRASAPEDKRTLLLQKVKSTVFVMQPGGSLTGEEEPSPARVTAWRQQQDLLGGSTPNAANLNAKRHLESIEGTIQTAMEIKDRAVRAGSTYAKEGPWPRWIPPALYTMRIIVEIYEARSEEDLGPLLKYTLERARAGVELLEEMWASELEREQEDEDEEEEEADQ